MKLMIINPDWGMTREQMDKRCRILSQYVQEGTDLSMECLTDTKVYLDSVADAVFAGPEILKMAMRAEAEGYDAVILYCFSDPVMEACRQAVRIPVIGCGQAACLLIPVLGYQGALLLADAERIPEKMFSIERTGLAEKRVAGFEAVTKKGLDPETQRAELLNELTAAGQRALQKTGAQVLVLGCLSYLGMAEELEKRLQVPVIDPAAAGVALAESVVRQKLTHSTRAFLTRAAMTMQE